MQHHIEKKWLAFALALATSVCFAKASPEAAMIQASFKKNFPDLVVEKITPSPISGIYQVLAGPVVLYASQDGRYLLSGDIIDLQQAQRNLTEQARKQARLDALVALGDANMITFSPRNPQYTVTVFTDVDCGYCRKLQSEMPEINAKGIAVRYVAFPRTGPDSAIFDKMVKVWCAQDKKQAIRLAKEDKPISGKSCSDQAVMQGFKLGLMMGVNGTPTIVFEDGTLFPGYLSPEDLLDAAKKIRQEKQS